jgi:hypothetical protein
VKKNKLDFVVIGAQKAGTTALHMYLRENSKIFLPPEKEAIFFSDDERYLKGVNWFFHEFFQEANDELKWGKSTPAYSCYSNISSARLKAHNRDIKIIYLLRDPVDRAISQYRMNKKRGVENNEINQLFQQLFMSDSMISAQNSPTETNSYLVWGEYHRVVNDYSWVENGNFLMMNDNFLSENTIDAVKVISEFLGVDFVASDVMSERFHVGGVRKFNVLDDIKKFKTLKSIWRGVIPFRYRRRVMYWMDQWNTKVDDKMPVLDEEMINKLKIHYNKEYSLIDELEYNGGYLIK